MTYGKCPDCGSKARRSWFKAFCDRCKVELTETKQTRLLQAFVSTVPLIIAMLLGQSGTEDILSQEPEDPASALFRYYMSLLVVAWIASAIFNHLVRKYWATYESPKNT